MRAADLKPGSLYWSPSGRRVKLMPIKDNGITRTAYLFHYVNAWGVVQEDGFAISASNSVSIAALREA